MATATKGSHPPVDQAVRDRIRDDLDANLCIEAGAGTGKTTSLVSRIVNLIASGTTNVDGLVAITFTELAAAELSTRVREGLEDARGKEDDPERLARINVAIAELHRARIETIHAFAASLLRERPIEAGLDPAFGVMSDTESSLSFDEHYEDWLHELLAGENREIERALNLGLGLRHVREAAETVNRYRFLLPLNLPKPSASEVHTKELLRWIKKNVKELQHLSDTCIDETDRGLPHLQRLLEFSSQVNSESPGPILERLILFAAPWPRIAGRKGSWENPESCDRMKDLFKEYQGLLDEARTELRTRALLTLLPRVEEFVSAYADSRRLAGAPDYDDLLIWARDLLRDKPAVRQYFQRRFQALLIDEFQDTDPIQAEIAVLLASGDGKSKVDPTKPWRELKILPGRLFVVGDPKQSIYRFRRADIGIYDEIKHGPLEAGLENLVQNFRSNERVLNWLNPIFDQLFVEEQGRQPANVPLTGDVKGDGGLKLGRPPVVVLRADASGMRAAQWQEEEAISVAKLLRDAVEGDESKRWPVRDPATKEVRPARWRDVAVLFPGRTLLGAYEDAFALAGIPNRHGGARDYFQRQEVRDLISILAAVDDPTDQVSIVGALRSLVFGCSDDDLVVHKATDGSWSYRIPRDKRESESEPVLDAFELLSSWNRVTRSLSLAELIEIVVTESRFVEACLALPDGDQAAANVLAIIDQARAFAGAGGGGLRAFTRWLTTSSEQDAVEVDTGVVEEADNVVRLMTIHGAKGLEYPIVVLAGLAGQGREWMEAVPDEPDRELHFRVGTKNRGVYATAGYDDERDAEKDARQAELIRLLYVGATRARDHLVIPHMRNVKSPGPLMTALEDFLPSVDGHEVKSDGAWLIEANELDPIKKASAARGSARQKEVEGAITKREAWMAQREDLLKEARTELPLVTASSRDRQVRPLAAEASHSAGALLTSEGPPLKIGDALHLVMERVSLPAAKDLDEVAESVCLEAGIPEHEDEVAELAKRCLASPTVKRALKLGTYQREIPFAVPDGGGFAVGRVDLVFRDSDGLNIVDFKTDEISASEAESHTLSHHGVQANVYTEGISGAAGVAVNRATFVYCRPNTEVIVTSRSQPAELIGSPTKTR